MASSGNRSTSRRHFLTGSAAVLAAAQFAPVMRLCDAEPAGEERKIGFAFVGIGSLAMHQLLPGIMKCKNARPVALVSGHPDKAAEQAHKYGIDAKKIYTYDNFDSIRNDPDVDVVYVVLPNSMHAEYTIRALRAGKHVLCEKPMAVSVQECNAMIDAAKTAGKILQIGYRLRYEPNTIAMIDAMGKKEAGPLQIIENGAGFSIGDPKQWRLNRALSGGGCLMDIGIYALNAARYISGEEPGEVGAFTYADTSDPRFKEVEAHCNFQLRFPSGVLASCTSSYATGLNKFVARCAKGWAELDPGLSYEGVKFRIQRDGKQPVEAPNLPEIDQFAAEMDHLARCILSKTASRTPGEEGLRDLRVIEAIYESARTGRAVKI